MARYADIDELLNNLPDDLPYKASVKRVLIQAPTADVVPKSEVAREIFEEIDELDIQLNNGDLDIKYFSSAVAKLKKKYTESEDKV